MLEPRSFALSDIVPFDLSSFTATVNGNDVLLTWPTATELNNRRFEIERRHVDGQFITIGVAEGHGSTTQW